MSAASTWLDPLALASRTSCFLKLGPTQRWCLRRRRHGGEQQLLGEGEGLACEAVKRTTVKLLADYFILFHSYIFI